MEEQNSNNLSEDLQGAQQEQPVVKNKGGRPKGVKNKPKKGRPKGSGKKRPVGRPPVFKRDGKVIKIPTVRQFKKKEKKEEIVVPQTLEAKPVKKSKAPKASEEDLLNAVLDDEKFTEAGYNTSTQKIINQEPIDPSYYYRGSKNIPVAGAQYEFTGDMVNELIKCKDDIVYFAENFFYIINLDRGKETIKLYDAQKDALKALVENRFCSLLSCRQAGKCFSSDTLLQIRCKSTGEIKNITAEELFEIISEPSVFKETAKIIETRKISNYEIMTDGGWQDLEAAYKTIPYQVWKIKTEDFFLDCADEHIVFTKDLKEVYVKDLRKGDEIMTEKGPQKINSIKKSNKIENMYDVAVKHENHRFYSNGILSHNSTILTIFALWMVCFNDDHRAAIVANKETTAINIFKRIRMAYEQLPNYIKPGVKDYAKTGMTLGNDSSIIVSTTSATSIRGDSLNTLAIDEAAFIEKHILEEFWSSVIPAISSGKKSKILMVSTPNSTDNKFYEIFSGAENGTISQWKSLRIDWWQVPGRDEKWKQDMIAVLGSEEKFLQEFGNQFLDDSTSAVGALLIERFKQTKKPAIWTSEEGDYSVFEYPDKNRLYVIGVDVGEGIGRAASVAQVLDVTDLQDIKQVAVYGSAVIEPYHFANKLLTIGQSWGVPPILIERNNCGAQVIDALHYHHNYEKIVAYSKISTSDKYNTTRNLGVLSHTNIRSDGIGNMRYWVNHLQCVQINDPQTISEFETFVKHPNGVYKKRTDKFFDDRIMSLVWALFILKTEIVEQYFQIVDFDLQNHPLKIVPNGYWENFSENYDLKDLSKNPSVVPKPAAEDSLAYPALGISQKELDTLDKYDLDEESLLEMGYTYYNQDV